MIQGFYLFTAIVFFIGSFFVGNASFDIAIHDTYVVIAFSSILQLFAILFLLFLIINRIRFYNSYPRFPSLLSIHYAVSILSLGVIFIGGYCSFNQPVYNDSFIPENNFGSTLILVGAIILIMVQFLFLLNLILVKNDTNQNEGL